MLFVGVKKKIITVRNVQMYKFEGQAMRWMKTDQPLKDGWYWRKCKADDPDPDCVEVINGIIIDSRPIDSHGAKWEIYEHNYFGGWLWYGPLKIPS